MRKLKISSATILAFIVVVSLVINLWFLFQVSNVGNALQSSADLQKKYPLLAKRILQENSNDVLVNFLDLRQTLQKETDPWGNNFALYFQYLPTGVSIGINQNNSFPAASLLKLPVVMAYYRHKENDGLIIDPTVMIAPQDIDAQFGKLWQKGAGYKINLADAARLAITDSDNTAVNILGHHIDQQDFQDVYDSLDIDLKIASGGAVMTAKNYSSILQSLYFSAVLTKDDSQTVLKFLTESNFDDKLSAGVPDDIPVAHKIGVVNENTYSDCGIVYIPQRQYLLCMVSQSDEQTASRRMSDISGIIYNYVNNKGRN